jgi:cellulose synthase/poly-beta-1,6-N-acetylglucosamine synthase-like glycosyltransferase
MLLAGSSIRSAKKADVENRTPSTRFTIVIPAHNEVRVIKDTVNRLSALDYPTHLFSIHVLADHCSDGTAEVARYTGAVVHERNEGPRSGKGAALSWLFRRILDKDQCDAIAIFDADTRVDPKFLRIMDWRLAKGDQVIQGQHIISNPDRGWYPALTWAMFIIDNRFQNLGRSNLGLSAKNMGDSICFKVDVLRKLGWGEGLTEDYYLRQKLLLEGIRIAYEPAAIGYGEAPLTFTQAQAQRARWLRGTRDSSHLFVKRLLLEGIKKRSLAMLDGAIQASLPSYSTMSLLSWLGLIISAIQLLIFHLLDTTFLIPLIGAWITVVGMLLVYPLVGLALERAPVKAYLVVLLGPYFILWRTWLAFITRFRRTQITWIRTEHGN